MLKKINQIMNIIIGAFIGSLIGYSVYRIIDFHTRPSFYAAQSAPWYTGILLQCAVTAVAVGIAAGIKLLIRKRIH